MNQATMFKNIKAAVKAAYSKDYTAALYAQMIKYGDELVSMTGVEFCEHMGISHHYATEFNKMKKLHSRLKEANFDKNQL